MIINPTYTPFSYDKRIAPLKAYKEEYDDVTKGIENLAKDTSTYSGNIPEDSMAGQKLAAYNQTLNDASAAIASGGLKSIDRATLSNLKRLYQQEIQPINEAAKQQEAIAAKIADDKSKHPLHLYGNIPSVDDLLKNPKMLPHVVDGKDLYTSGISIASALSPEDVDSYISGNEESLASIDDIVNALGEKFNVGALSDPELAKQIIYNGLNTGVSKMKKQYDAAAVQRERAQHVGSRRRSSGGGGSGSSSRGSGRDPGDNFFTDDDGNVWQRRKSMTTAALGKAMNTEGYKEQEIDGETWVHVPKGNSEEKKQEPAFKLKAGLYNATEASLTTETNIKKEKDLEEPSRVKMSNMNDEEKEAVLRIIDKRNLTSEEESLLDRDYNFEVRYAGKRRNRHLVSVKIIKKSDRAAIRRDRQQSAPTQSGAQSQNNNDDLNIGL